MTNFIPIFPLSIIVYPGENLNLHVFEDRYKQLINDCYKNKKPFGIPAVIDDKMQDYGTLMHITELSHVEKNGDMDIKTKGDKVFRILEVIKEIPEKLYCGAIVNYPVNMQLTNPATLKKIVHSIRELHRMLNITKEFSKSDEELNSYDLAHHVGLTTHEEYELLNLMQEKQRMEYLKRHLNKVIPLIAEMENLKLKIKKNGHFKNLSGFKFDL